jgi:hypothetical protein
MRQARRAATALLALTLFAAGGAACGDDDDEGSEDTTTTTAPEPEAVEVTAVDYGYEGLPESIAAGTQLTLTNESDVELHELVAFLLPEDETRTAEEISKLPEAELGELFAGEPATVLLAPPAGGEMIPAVGDGVLDDPGRYVIFCAIPQGADPDAYLNAPPSDGPPEVEGGPPHFTLGMYAETTVG